MVDKINEEGLLGLYLDLKTKLFKILLPIFNYF